MQALSPAALASVPINVRRPNFNPQLLRPGILHLGCGAFHRAHQALLTQRAINADIGRGLGMEAKPLPPWGIVSASLRTPTTARALQRQGGLYTVLERGPLGTQVEVVGTLRQVIFVPEDRAALNACFADPAVRIVTLTVTNSGYHIDSATGRLDARHPDIVADLCMVVPSSAIGVLVKGLALRRTRGIAPPVVLSCDNIIANGRTVRQACVDYAALQSDSLSQWIGANVQFPSTMVDRIVPVASDDDHEDAAAALGLIDAAPVSAEPYCQWVIEHFDGPRPSWEAAGAEMVTDVSPWETTKLRLLNGGHLAMACLGLLAGFQTVAQTVADPDFAAFALRFMLDEQKPTLPPSPHDVDSYAHDLLARWRNPGIAHQLERICRDGSSKLPARLLAPLRQNLQDHRPTPCTFLAIAAWMRCVSGLTETGRPMLVRDQLSARLRPLIRQAAGDGARLVDIFLDVPEVFAGDLARHATVRLELQRAMALLQHRGARQAMAHCLSSGVLACP